LNESIFLHFAIRADPLAELADFAVLAGWVGFVIVVAVGHRGAAPGAAKRDSRSSFGFLLQFVGYAIYFVFPREYFSPLLPMPRLAEKILTFVEVLLVIASFAFCYAAARALGRHWALVARVIDGHEIISSGPFAIVRNPIYFSMLGMYFATGLAVGRWRAILAGFPVFLVGTAIRIRTEENLLREKFGPAFDDYARRVPAFLPRLL
jgi:protein-S-isoprenylcysteine O-methyltransferase Ste14